MGTLAPNALYVPILPKGLEDCSPASLLSCTLKQCNTVSGSRVAEVWGFTVLVRPGKPRRVNRVAGCMVWRVVPQATEWQHVGNQIDAVMIFARAQFVNVRTE